MRKIEDEHFQNRGCPAQFVASSIKRKRCNGQMDVQEEDNRSQRSPMSIKSTLCTMSVSTLAFLGCLMFEKLKFYTVMSNVDFSDIRHCYQHPKLTVLGHLHADPTMSNVNLQGLMSEETLQSTLDPPQINIVLPKTSYY